MSPASGPAQRNWHVARRASAWSVGTLLTALACFSGDPVSGPLPDECRTLALEAGVNPDTEGVEVVGIQGFAFVPAEIRIAPGTEVVWVNCEPANTPGSDHTTTSDTGELWDSGLLTRGELYRRDFDEEGSFGYHCTPHPFMVGRVSVVSP